MASVTIEQLFADLQDQHFESRRQLEAAVVDSVNRHVGDLPIGYTYVDAIDEARVRGWLVTNGGGHGVHVRLVAQAATA